jgi:hypothetical protein
MTDLEAIRQVWALAMTNATVPGDKKLEDKCHIALEQVSKLMKRVENGSPTGKAFEVLHAHGEVSYMGDDVIGFREGYLDDTALGAAVTDEQIREALVRVAEDGELEDYERHTNVKEEWRALVCAVLLEIVNAETQGKAKKEDVL